MNRVKKRKGGIASHPHRSAEFMEEENVKISVTVGKEKIRKKNLTVLLCYSYIIF